MRWLKQSLIIVSCFALSGLSNQWSSSHNPNGVDLFAIAFEICSSINNVTSDEAHETLDMYAPHPCLRKCHLEMLNMLNPNDPEFSYRCSYSLEEILPELHHVIGIKQHDFKQGINEESFPSKTKEYTEENSQNNNNANNLQDVDKPINPYKPNKNNSLEWSGKELDTSCSCGKIIENLEENPKDYMINAQCHCNLPMKNKVFSITDNVSIKTEIEIDFEEL